MIDTMFEGKNIIHKALDAAWLRNQVISQNISNVDTPGYKRNSVSFEEHLIRAMSKDDFDNSEVADIDIKVIKDNANLSTRLDGNNVNIDNESAALANNSIRFNALAQNAGYSSIKYVLDNS